MKHTVSELVLKNGARGLLIHVPDATVMTYEFNFRAGEYLVKRNKWEVPHLMEHVLLGANQQIRKARAFQAEFEKNGAYSNASTNVYAITYEAECADFEWDRVLELLLVAMSKPLFLQEEFDAEYGNVRDELVSRSNNHFRTLVLKMREQSGLLSVSDRERIRLMKNVTREDIAAHFKRTHFCKNMRFIIAGNLKGREVSLKKSLNQLDLPTDRDRFELPHEIPQTTGKPVFIPNKTVKNIYFFIETYALCRFEKADWDALGLVNTMLTETLYSRILGEARERGLVYSMSSDLSYTKDASLWWFGAQILPENAPELFDIIIRELKRVREGDISQEDLDSAKQYLLGRYQRSGQTVGGMAAGYSGRYYFDDDIDDYYAIPDRIKAVTKERIVEAANRMFEDKIGGLGVLGGTDKELPNRLNEQIAVLWQ